MFVESMDCVKMFLFVPFLLRDWSLLCLTSLLHVAAVRVSTEGYWFKAVVTDVLTAFCGLIYSENYC